MIYTSIRSLFPKQRCFRQLIWNSIKLCGRSKMYAVYMCSLCIVNLDN